MPTAGGFLQALYPVPSGRLWEQVAWCHFRDEGEALCLLQAGALSAYTLAGELQGVPLPPGFTALWALPQGLLLAVRAQYTPVFRHTTRWPASCRACRYRPASPPHGRCRRACCWRCALRSPVSGTL